MELINLSNTSLKEAIKIAKKIIINDGIIIHPTDTIYGLACNPFNIHTYKKIFEIKQRLLDKEVSFQVSSFFEIIKYVQTKKLPENFNLEYFCNKLFPGALTIILPSNARLLPKHLKFYKNIGFRIPDHPLCKLLNKGFDFPLITTSANLSGIPYSNNIANIIESFSGKVEAIFFSNDEPSSIPSTIIKIGKDGLKLLREGCIKIDKINKVYLDSFM